MALGDSPKRYKEGEPYAFESGAAEEISDESVGSNKDLLFPDTKGYKVMNVAAPFGLLRNPHQAHPKEFAADACGGCGAKERGDGDPLLSCSKCKRGSTAARSASKRTSRNTSRCARHLKGLD